jgi:hypothetical protein
MTTTECLKLFGPTGQEIPASRRDLLRVEGQSFNQRLYQRLLGSTPGTYWLVSARPGHVRMLLQISWYRGHGGHGWSVSFCVNGIASYPHWDLETVLRQFTEYPEPADGVFGYTHIPANVEALTREHVKFVPGAIDDSAGPRPQFSITTLPPDKMRSALLQFVPSGTDISPLTDLGGRPVEIVELALAVNMFCGEHDLDSREADVMRATVPLTSRLRLRRLSARLGAQLASE